MRIGLDLRLFGTEHGGIGRYCQELFPRLLQLDKTNQYFLFTNKISPDGIKLLKKQNSQIIETNIRHYSLGEQLGFLRILNKHNLDLAHFPNFNLPIFYKKPFVVTIHDLVHHKISGAKKSRWLHFLAYKKVIQAAAKQSQKIITVSEASKKDIGQLLSGDGQINPEKISVIYEGASLNTQVSDKNVDTVKKRYLIKRPYFLFVGVLERKKNLVSLTRGFDNFLEKFGADMDMVIVGKADSHYPEIRHQALDIKRSDRLIFTGPVDEWELESLYKGAFAYLSASLHEGFGLPGVEALGFGLPLLVSNINVFNEIYDNAAVYFNPLDPQDIAEKMNLLTRDSQFYEQMKQKSLARAKLFSWEKAARETLEVYEEVLKSEVQI